MKKIIIMLPIVLSCSIAKAETATFYHDWFIGRNMANGKKFYQYKTKNQKYEYAAHMSLPLGTIVEVSRGYRKIRVKISDRGNFDRNNFDLSKGAFAKLAPLSNGVINVKIKVIYKPQKTHRRKHESKNNLFRSLPRSSR